MDSRRAGAEQLLALFRGVLDAKLRNRRVIVAQLFQPRG